MLRTTFPNSYRSPYDGTPYGIHRSPLEWISDLGLTDHTGQPLNSKNAEYVLSTYGPGAAQPDQQITLHSDSGDHEYDQAANYLGQQAIQQGRTWFPKLGPQVPSHMAVQAANVLQQKLQGHASSWAKASWDTPYKKEEPCYGCLEKMADWIFTADLYDPGTEPTWMGNDDPNTKPCSICGKRGCNHQVMDGVNPIWHGQWEMDNHGVSTGVWD